MISSKQQISHRPSSSKQTNASTNLNNVDRDALSRTAETADVLLQISVHILKHQVKHRLAFLVLALLDIHQPVDQHRKNPSYKQAETEEESKTPPTDHESSRK